MILRAGAEQEIHALVTTLIQQAKRCKHVGLIEQAIAIFTQSWTIARIEAPDLADEAAWNIAWLEMRNNAYANAATWFERVNQPPSIDDHWMPMRDMLVQACRSQSTSSVEVGAPQHIAHSLPQLQASLPALKVTSLGCFRITRGTDPLPPCPTRKGLAIFRYLLTRRYHTAGKEEIMELLWPDSPPDRAAHNLHVAIGTLRRYLDPDSGSYVVWEMGGYRLHSEEPIDDDRLAFLRLCDEADLCRRSDQQSRAVALYSEAIERYTGDYYIDESDVAWALAERERLLTRYLLALERLGTLYQVEQQYEGAIQCYNRLIERDPYREEIVCELIRCFCHLGRRVDALHQYQRLAHTLRNDLGIDPAPETQTFYERIAAPLKRE